MAAQGWTRQNIGNVDANAAKALEKKDPRLKGLTAMLLHMAYELRGDIGQCTGDLEGSRLQLQARAANLHEVRVDRLLGVDWVGRNKDGPHPLVVSSSSPELLLSSLLYWKMSASGAARLLHWVGARYNGNLRLPKTVLLW